MSRRKFLSFFSALFLVIYGFNALVYAVLAALGFRVFGSLYRMIQYHDRNPYQFILVFSIILAICAAVWIVRFRSPKGPMKYLGTVAVFSAAFLVSCAAGGLLWKIYDMQAGFTPAGIRFWTDLLWGMKTGLLFGWQITLFSFPYNLIVLAGDVAAVLVFHDPSRFSLWRKHE